MTDDVRLPTGDDVEKIAACKRVYMEYVALRDELKDRNYKVEASDEEYFAHVFGGFERRNRAVLKISLEL